MPRATSFWQWFSNWLFRRKQLSLGVYGPTNAGKTTLANRICMDLAGEPLGVVSMVPHETRLVQRKEKLTLKANGWNVSMNLLDMPGVAVKVDYRDFLAYGLSVDEAQRRAKEATRGIVEAVRWLENVDAALVVLDAAEDPYTQVNVTVLGNLEARNIPIVLVANKTDLPESNAARIREAFPHYHLVEVSALTGQNIDQLYETIATKI